jgi:FtsP/CotA-like multicopper oxidase with cupredoxin domain
MHDNRLPLGRFLRGAAVALASLLAGAVQAAAPGITGTGTTGTFNLTASPSYLSQPDGASIYSWGYGCTTGSTPAFKPAAIGGAACGTMQVPGPTLIVTQGSTVTVTLTNNLPKAAGNTSILFPGFTLTGTGCSAGAVQGLLTCEAPPAGSATYTFVATTPGTRAYYSGTQGDLQVEMGLYGALIVRPTLSGSGLPTAYAKQTGAADTCYGLGNTIAALRGDGDFRLDAAAYDNPQACYDREYLFQMSEIDPRIHTQAEQQKGLPCTQPTGCMVVETEPYHPVYFLLNGRSFPDTVDPNYSVQYPRQPYNANPHMHPGELTLVRIIGQGRLQHPFHEHANHVRVLARDGNLLLTATKKLAGPLLFTTSTTPGMAMDVIFQFTAKNLNWDIHGHTADAALAGPGTEGNGGAPCSPDANGYYTTGSPIPAPVTAPNYFEWCADHKKALESKPFGNVGSGGPVTLPDPNILTNGPWYSGSPYFGPDASARAAGPTIRAARRASPTCGTRITSARSRPTTSSPAE